MYAIRGVQLGPAALPGCAGTFCVLAMARYGKGHRATHLATCPTAGLLAAGSVRAQTARQSDQVGQLTGCAHERSASALHDHEARSMRWLPVVHKWACQPRMHSGTRQLQVQLAAVPAVHCLGPREPQPLSKQVWPSGLGCYLRMNPASQCRRQLLHYAHVPPCERLQQDQPSAPAPRSCRPSVRSPARSCGMLPSNSPAQAHNLCLKPPPPFVLNASSSIPSIPSPSTVYSYSPRPPATPLAHAPLFLARSRALYSSKVPWKGVTRPSSHIHSSSTVLSIRNWSCDTWGGQGTPCRSGRTGAGALLRVANQRARRRSRTAATLDPQPLPTFQQSCARQWKVRPPLPVPTACKCRRAIAYTANPRLQDDIIVPYACGPYKYILRVVVPCALASTHHEHSPLEGGQALDEGVDGVDVQVVGRLWGGGPRGRRLVTVKLRAGPVCGCVAAGNGAGAQTSPAPSSSGQRRLPPPPPPSLPSRPLPHRPAAGCAAW